MTKQYKDYVGKLYQFQDERDYYLICSKDKNRVYRVINLVTNTFFHYSQVSYENDIQRGFIKFL